MGRSAKKGGAPLEQLGGAPIDRAQLSECLNTTSTIAAECNQVLQSLLGGRCGVGWAGAAGGGVPSSPAPPPLTCGPAPASAPLVCRDGAW